MLPLKKSKLFSPIKNLFYFAYHLNQLKTFEIIAVVQKYIHESIAYVDKYKEGTKVAVVMESSYLEVKRLSMQSCSIKKVDVRDNLEEQTLLKQTGV